MAARLDQGLRKDAAENRERLLVAAGELFAARGLDVSLNDIAHHAGVGVGTAYRRFKNKQEVIDALFEERLQGVVTVAEEALSDSDPWRGLVAFLERSLDMQFGDRGLNQIINGPHLGAARIANARDLIAPLITQLVDRAKTAGVVRPDFDQSDLIFMQLGLSAIMNSSRKQAPHLYRRYLTLWFDAIRTDRASFSDLPVASLTAEETHEVMTHGRTVATSS